MVISSFFPGAEITTFFTLPRRCFEASFASVKRPVDSTTTCAPMPGQSISAGSLIAKILMRLPSTTMASASNWTSAFSVPSVESYFNKCASVLGSVKSFAATISIFGLCKAARTTFLPMRPKPLIPTLMAIVLFLSCELDASLRLLIVTQFALDFRDYAVAVVVLQIVAQPAQRHADNIAMVQTRT